MSQSKLGVITVVEGPGGKSMGRIRTVWLI